MSFIQVQDVSKNYGKVKVLDSVNLSLPEKGQYVIRGSSGSGKSTFLYLLGALDAPCSGRIKVGDLEISAMQDQELASYRNNYVGFVFQFHYLLSSMNCLDNMMLPARISGKITKKLREELAHLASELGVGHCLQKYPYELSGGEQQRINILRALSLKPRLLLCDEPTGNLDSENSAKVVTMLKTLAAEQGSTMLLVTHDGEVASSFTHQIKMADGRFVSA